MSHTEPDSIDGQPPDKGHRMTSSLHGRMLAGLAIGLAGGTAVALLRIPALRSAVEPIGIIGTLWVNALLMVVIPLVVSSLIVSIATVADVPRLGALLGRTLTLFLAFLAAAAFGAAAIVPRLFAAVPPTPALLSPASPAGGSIDRLPGAIPSIGEWIAGLVPANPIKAAADGAMLPLIVFALALGFAAAGAGGRSRETLLGFFRAVVVVMHRILQWILWASPFGVAALALVLAARAGTVATWAMGYYIVVQCGFMLVATAVLYPVVALFGRLEMRRFAVACLPAQTVALGSQSSLASLPAMLDAAERHLKIPAPLASFVLPLAVATFKYAAPALTVSGVSFVSRLIGVALGPGQMLSVIGIAVALSFVAPGIPNGGVLVMAPAFLAAGLPLEAIGVVLALDIVPGALRTMANVTADLAVVTILNRSVATSPSGSQPLAPQPLS